MEQEMPDTIYAVKTIAYDVDNVVDYIKQWFPEKDNVNIHDVIYAIDLFLEEDNNSDHHRFVLKDKDGNVISDEDRNVFSDD